MLIEVGHTRVICNASIEDKVPPFLRNTGKGWVTAEYGMLPRATIDAIGTRGRVGKGRRTDHGDPAADRPIDALGDQARTSWRAHHLAGLRRDPGRRRHRCASITGAFVALVLALGKLKQADQLKTIPISDYVAATSVGIVGGMPLLDLAYEEDSKADVDMNIVKTSDGRFIEIQGTAEAEPFSTDTLTGLLALADKGITDLIAKQREIVGPILGR